MRPNLYVAVSNLVQPWKLFKSSDVAQNNTREMHISSEPVPGIYAITPKNKRYLVAIKPNGMKETEHIFQERKTATRRVETLKSVTTPTSTLYESGYDATKKEVTTTFMEIYGSCTSLESATKKISTENCNRDTGSTGRAVDPSSLSNVNPNIDSKQPTTASTTCRSKKYCICPPGKVIHSIDYIFNLDGHLPPQQSLWRRQNLKRKARSTSFLSFRFKDKPQGLEQIDIIGYQFLAKPLEVEFNGLLKRWMFCSEVRERSVVSPMCVDVRCMEKDPTTCGKPKWRKLFVLDDGETYVVVANRGRWRRRKKDWSDILYCVDEESEMIRRQTVKELNLSSRNLEKAKPRFLGNDDGAEYMPVVRYLDGKQGMEDGNLGHIEDLTNKD